MAARGCSVEAREDRKQIPSVSCCRCPRPSSIVVRILLHLRTRRCGPFCLQALSCDRRSRRTLKEHSSSNIVSRYKKERNGFLLFFALKKIDTSSTNSTIIIIIKKQSSRTLRERSSPASALPRRRGLAPRRPPSSLTSFFGGKRRRGNSRRRRCACLRLPASRRAQRRRPSTTAATAMATALLLLPLPVLLHLLLEASSRCSPLSSPRPPDDAGSSASGLRGPSETPYAPRRCQQRLDRGEGPGLRLRPRRRLCRPVLRLRLPLPPLRALCRARAGGGCSSTSCSEP